MSGGEIHAMQGVQADHIDFIRATCPQEERQMWIFNLFCLTGGVSWEMVKILSCYYFDFVDRREWNCSKTWAEKFPLGINVCKAVPECCLLVTRNNSEY